MYLTYIYDIYIITNIFISQILPTHPRPVFRNFTFFRNFKIKQMQCCKKENNTKFYPIKSHQAFFPGHADETAACFFL